MWYSLALGAAIAVAGLAGYEALWRSRGFTPTLIDSESLWCSARAEVAPQTVVLVGSSRLQYGIDPRLLSQGLGGRRVVQLALQGANPLPVLDGLANDTTFRGSVVLEYMPRRLFTPDSWATERARSFMASCRDPSLIAPVEAILSRVLQRRFVLMQPEVQAIGVLAYVARHRKLPGGVRIDVRDDRFVAGHMDAEPARGVPEDHWQSTTEPEIAQRIERMRIAVAKIRGRGGDVQLYRSPVSGRVLEDEERRFPASEWLPRLAQQVGLRVIDFAALADIRNVVCPDGEHPAPAQVPLITKTLAAELTRQ